MTAEKLSEINQAYQLINTLSKEIEKCNQIITKKLFENVRFTGNNQQEAVLYPDSELLIQLISSYKDALTLKHKELESKFKKM